MKKAKRILTVALAALMATFCATACGDKEEAALKKGKIQVIFWNQISASADASLTELTKTYNRTNTDNVYVQLFPKSAGYSQQLATTLNGSNPPDIVYVDDRYFKNFVKNGYLECLDSYVAESGTELSDIWPSTVDRFRFNADTGYSGGDNPLYALPGDNVPTVIYYNVTQFKKQKINIISIAEEEIDAYNEANGTHYLARGYYAYNTDPATGSQVRSDGKYHVFNNQIPMSWDELRECARIFTKEFNTSSDSRYGFMNEWWFSYGWSVGGDCLEFVSDPNDDGDTSDGQYMFSLGEKTPNYLVTGSAAVTVNGNTYNAGDILSYDDKHYVEDHKSDAAIAGYLAGEQLYELPSIYDAFLEFCRLSQTTNRDVTTGVKGYGISPSPTTLNQKGKNLYFTSGETAMLCQSLESVYTIGRSMSSEWDVAPLYQYREYDETTGKLKTVNGTEIKGKKSAHNQSNGYAIPANSQKKAAAWKFINYLMSAEAQAQLIDSNAVPCRISVANSDAYKNYDKNYAPKNKAALVDAAGYCTVGDWSYVEDGEWINGWANILNTKVRDGDMTLDEFFAHSIIGTTNTTLQKYTAKKYNG